MHKGQCRKDDHVYHGDHKHTVYYVSRVVLYPKSQRYLITAVNEHTFDVVRLNHKTAPQYHRVVDCASYKRRPPNTHHPKPAAHQNIVIGKNAKSRKH